jgi:hypothetical protein
MPDLRFEVMDIIAPEYAAVPQLSVQLRVSNITAGEDIASIALRCQVQIAATKRRYSPDAQARLLDVFGEPHRWATTLRSLLWTHTSTVVPSFGGSIMADLPIPCTYDFEVVGTKYFDAVGEGEIPLTFLFSGTVFYKNPQGMLQVVQIPWSKEAEYRLPVTIWRAMMARYYPNSAWVHMPKEVFDQLAHYKAIHSLPTWEDVFTRLLAVQAEEADA